MRKHAYVLNGNTAVNVEYISICFTWINSAQTQTRIILTKHIPLYLNKVLRLSRLCKQIRLYTQKTVLSH